MVFVFGLALLFGLVLFSPVGIVITAGLCSSRAFVCLFRMRYCLSFFSSSWYQGLAVACDYDTTWTFLLTLLRLVWNANVML